MTAKKSLPSFAMLLDNYPHEGGPEVPKALIGGDVNAAWIHDTCAIGMSRALNYSGFPLPARGKSKMCVLKGGDGLWYAIRVAELKHWLQPKLDRLILQRTKDLLSAWTNTSGAREFWL